MYSRLQVKDMDVIRLYQSYGMTNANVESSRLSLLSTGIIVLYTKLRSLKNDTDTWIFAQRAALLEA